MGTYYALNIVKTFEAEPMQPLSMQQLETKVNERLDLALFDVTFTNNSLRGTLKPGLFQENIEDFFNILRQITNRSDILYYFQEFGNDIEEYPTEFERWVIYDREENRIDLKGDLVALFLEGKVAAEDFQIQQLLINWLFRHSSFDNPLAGAVTSSIFG